MKIAPAEKDSIPAGRDYAEEFIDWLEFKKVPRLFQRMSRHTINFFLGWARYAVHKFRYWVLGQRGVYRVIGPGELYIQTRIPS